MPQGQIAASRMGKPVWATFVVSKVLCFLVIAARLVNKGQVERNPRVTVVF